MVAGKKKADSWHKQILQQGTSWKSAREANRVQVRYFSTWEELCGFLALCSNNPLFPHLAHPKRSLQPLWLWICIPSSRAAAAAGKAWLYSPLTWQPLVQLWMLMLRRRQGERRTRSTALTIRFASCL